MPSSLWLLISSTPSALGLKLIIASQMFSLAHLKRILPQQFESLEIPSTHNDTLCHIIPKTYEAYAAIVGQTFKKWANYHGHSYQIPAVCISLAGPSLTTQLLNSFLGLWTKKILIGLPPNELNVSFGYFWPAWSNVNLFILYEPHSSQVRLFWTVLHQFTRGKNKTQM